MSDKILIVDDDMDTLRLVGLMLERQGFSIVAANNGDQAIDMAQREIPDLILLDVMMPGMDGFEVTRRLRDMKITATIPIIMFTAKTQVDDKVQGFESGADDYLTKPTHPAELIARVKTVLSRAAQKRKEGDTGPYKKKFLGKTIGVIAAKGGVGVTTLALNLGISLQLALNSQSEGAEEGKEDYAVVAEMRPGQGGIAFRLGLTPPEDLTKLLEKQEPVTLKDVEGALKTHTSGLRLLMASYNPEDTQFLTSTEKLETILQSLPHYGMYNILDLGSTLTMTTEKLLTLCDRVILVIEPISSSITQAKILLEALEDKGLEDDVISPILYNRTRIELKLSPSEVEEQLGRKIDMFFTPAPELAYQALSRETPMTLQDPGSLSARHFQKLAQKIIEELPITLDE